MIVVDRGLHYLRVSRVVQTTPPPGWRPGMPIETRPHVEQVLGASRPDDSIVAAELRYWLESDRLAKYREDHLFYDPDDLVGAEIPNAAAALILAEEYRNVRNVLTSAVVMKYELLSCLPLLDFPGSVPEPPELEYKILALYNLAVYERRIGDSHEFDKTIQCLPGLAVYESISLTAESLVKEIRSIV